MITFSQLGKYGRLGNQLFQYAALRSLSLERGYECKIPNPQEMEWHGQKCLMDQFNIKADYLEEKDYSKIRYRYYEPMIEKADKNFLHLGDGADIIGYFQSYQYFKDYEKEIVEELTPNDILLNKAGEILETIKEQDTEIVSLHVRRGDNQDGTNPQYNDFYGKNDILTDDSPYGKYLKQTFEIFKNKKVKYLVFSGGTRAKKGSNLTDIEWCKNNMKGDNITYSEGLSDIMDFTLMTLCDHNVICHLSSFGYWSGILNKNPDKIVVAPEDYSLGADNRAANGFYPKEWRII
tara:strand:- start:2931 stop:3806 length:876 start_codon:yes stop_codon:yes gene_type:complete